MTKHGNGGAADNRPAVKTRVGVLDSSGVLIGYTRVDKPAPDHVVVPEDCDLPADGRYKWDGAKFVPLGHGFGKPLPPPVPLEHALYLTMKALLEDPNVNLPHEVEQYCDWYDRVLRARNEEQIRARKGKG